MNHTITIAITIQAQFLKNGMYKLKDQHSYVYMTNKPIIASHKLSLIIYKLQITFLIPNGCTDLLKLMCPFLYSILHYSQVTLWCWHVQEHIINRDQSILLLFLPIFLWKFWQIFFLTYYAQDYAQDFAQKCFNILLKSKLYTSYL